MLKSDFSNVTACPDVPVFVILVALKFPLEEPHHNVYVKVVFASSSVAFAVTIIVLFVFAFAAPVGVSTNVGAVLYFILTVSCFDAV